MPSHLTDIGFITNTEEEFLTLAKHAYEHGEPFATAHGTYFRWSPGAGVELWGQVDLEGDFIGLNPHFTGEGRVRVGLTAKLERPASSLDGAFHGWASPSTEQADSGSYPFVFDTPDFRCYDAAQLPCIAEAQIAAFAHEITAYKSEEDFDSAQSEDMMLAAEAFIPSGLFSPEGETTEPPEAHAIFSGHVLDTALRINPFTQQAFRWAKVQSYGGMFEVVADPMIVTGEVVRGGILQGAFWLSGRLLAVAQS